MTAIRTQLEKHFPDLVVTDLVLTLEEHAEILHVSEGDTLIEIGGYARFMPLVTAGALKVVREDEHGNEVFLYFLYPGQSCAMTVQCCMVDLPSEIRAVAEADTELIAIPKRLLADLMKLRVWNDFILGAYNQRFTELLRTIDGLVFQRLDDRIMDYLMGKTKISGNHTIHTTHQEIAIDLNSSREVISRLLKQLEKRGDIKLGRGSIEVLGNR